MTSVQSRPQQLNGNKLLIMNRYFFLLLFTCLLSIRMPAQDVLSKMRSDEVITINEKEYYLHTVKKGQTLYMISKAYGVEVNDIIRENPNVKEGLDSGMKLKILKKEEPGKKKAVRTQDLPKQKEVVPPLQPATVTEVLPCGTDRSNMKDVYNIALMLPLFLNEVTAIDVTNVSGEDMEAFKCFQFLPFYEGFKMALDSLRKTGSRLKVYVYDVDKDTVRTRKILKNPEMKTMDLIVGLLYNRNFQIVADFALKNSIPIVNPISERDQIIVNNPYVIKVRPALRTQSQYIGNLIRRDFPGSNIILLRNNQEKIGSIPDSLKAGLNAITATGYDDAVRHLRKDTNNVLLLFSDNKSFILDNVTKFNEIRGEYRITLVGVPRWDMIDEIESDYLVNLRTHIFAPYFIDYENTDVKKFVLNYQNQYYTDPDVLAFQGFDVAMYFSNALKLYGKNFQRCLPGFTPRSLETHYEFIQSSPKNGYENRNWDVYWYDNFHLRLKD